MKKAQLMAIGGILTSEGLRRKYLWAALSSVLAGLCIGTKYPGGIVLVPLLLAIAFARARDPRKRDTAMLAVASLFIAAVTFVVTTPGSVLQPLNFISDLLYEVEHYSAGHGGYTVVPGLDHLSKLLTYLFVVAPSANIVVAVAASLLALVGIGFLIRMQPRAALWLLSLPILYIAYMSLQSVMIVRNYLLLLPFLAIFTSLGVLVLSQTLRDRYPLHLLVVGGSVLLVVFNLSLATRSSLSIYSPSAPPPEVALEEHIAASPETMFYLSPASVELLGEGALEKHANLVKRIENSDRFIFRSNEFTNWKLLMANVPGRYRTVWKQMEEVNWDYYPSWEGHQRILEVSPTDPDLKGLIDGILPTRQSRNQEPWSKP